MNCLVRFSEWVSEDPGRCAIWLTDRTSLTFRGLEDRAAKIQKCLRDAGLKPGDHVLLSVEVGMDLYASMIGILASGCVALLIEPWMTHAQIESVIARVKPKAFLAGNKGRFWGLRNRSIRNIQSWISPQPDSTVTERLAVVSVQSEHPAIVTYTTNVAGQPKGVVRSHSNLWEQHLTLEANLRAAHPGETPDHSNKPDWCIFTHFTLGNLSSGRTTLLMSSDWRRRDFLAIEQLPKALAPRSLTCGPAFLKKMLEHRLKLPSIESIHVGGALTENDMLEAAFDAFPDALFTHVYGAAEAEPVACIDARISVLESRNQGYLQMLCLGKAVPEIQHRAEPSALWVSGKHVGPKYLDDEADNRIFKHQDEAGRIWHNLGDRIRPDESGVFWYAGRSQQPFEEFEIEQKAYVILGHSAAFLHRDSNKHLWLIGERVTDVERDLRKELPEIDYIENAQIFRDARHRARIDRMATLKQGAPWLLTF